MKQVWQISPRKHYFISILIVLLGAQFSFNPVFAQLENGKLIKDNDGISVYKIKNAHENLNRIIARMKVESNYLEVLCLVKDFEHQKDWIYANHKAFMLDSISPYCWIYYGVSETPWPLLDRDVVAEVELTIDTSQNAIIIHSTAKPDMIPASKDLVRIQMLDSKWTIIKVDQNHSIIELDLLVDVGGNIPRWVVNLFSSKGPTGTFKNLKKELEKDIDRACAYNELLK